MVLSISEEMADYRNRHVVVTGGTGALGTAVVAALVEAGATCHVPWLHEDEAQRFVYRKHKQVKLVGNVDLTDEAAVGRLFGNVTALWASIHIAGGFAMAPVAIPQGRPDEAA
jgi:NAD(P)-dependent dehydrogenase (short-subunit alcohol dehydrogenase family)